MPKQLLRLIQTTFLYSAASLTLLGLAFIFPHAWREQAVPLSPLENIHSLPFPIIDGVVQIDEPLAHLDVMLDRPVLAQTLRLTLTVIPSGLRTLHVGIRENSFWLSYPERFLLFDENHQAGDQLTLSLEIPLTDKLQESDRSLDVMFIANADETLLNPTSQSSRLVAWQLVSIQADVVPSRPALSAVKDYLRSILHRERAL